MNSGEIFRFLFHSQEGQKQPTMPVEVKKTGPAGPANEVYFIYFSKH